MWKNTSWWQSQRSTKHSYNNNLVLSKWGEQNYCWTIRFTKDFDSTLVIETKVDLCKEESLLLTETNGLADKLGTWLLMESICYAKRKLIMSNLSPSNKSFGWNKNIKELFYLWIHRKNLTEFVGFTCQEVSNKL